MTEHVDLPMETVLVGWARDANGDSRRFTGEDIYNRGGVWCMQRLTRDIPAMVTYYCTNLGLHFAVTLVIVPERAVPLGVRLRRPDEVDTLGDMVLLAYKHPEDA